jgi:hypothetical protein
MLTTPRIGGVLALSVPFALNRHQSLSLGACVCIFPSLVPVDNAFSSFIVTQMNESLKILAIIFWPNPPFLKQLDYTNLKATWASHVRNELHASIDNFLQLFKVVLITVFLPQNG